MTPEEIQNVINQFNSWDISNSNISLWGFRKRKSQEQVTYTAKWINADTNLTASLAAIFANYQQGFREATAYDLLAEAIDTQFLHIEKELTHSDLLTILLERPREENQAEGPKDLENITGYVIRIQNGTRTAYAVKKTEQSWNARKSTNFLNVIYSDGELSLVEDRAFRFENKFDFIVFDDSILIHNKKMFESLLDYRNDFINSLQTLSTEQEFVSAFESTTEIVNFVGTNMLHLRRMQVVRQKGLYKDPSFLQKVQAVNAKSNWGLFFDSQGKIIPTPDTVRTIITVLLDHRLKSELTDTTYDVPSSTKVT